MEYPLDHIAIAVPDLAAALPLYEALTGTAGSRPERVDSQRVDVAFLGSGETRIELIAPTGPESTVARFLERRGPGLHHIALRVPDVTAALAELSAAGVRAIDTEPRIGAHGRRIAFLHPGTCGGVLVELVEGDISG